MYRVKLCVLFLFALTTYIQSSLSMELQITVSGRNGQDGTHGYTESAGALNGGDGTSAIPGLPGQDAGKIYLKLTALKNPSYSSWNILAQGYYLQPNKAEESQVNWTHPLDPSLKINLSANGGNGADGTNGGKGQNGQTGHPGRNATSSSCGTNGGRGGDGGDGGKGSDGQNGGCGGTITIDIDEEDMDLLMLFRQWPQVVGGKGGLPGRGGNGGYGGSGGRGGSGHSWTTTTYSHTYVNGRMQTIPHTIHHHNPGGHQGPSGSNGNDGQNGKAGKNAPNGQLLIRVKQKGSDQINSYNGFYDLKVTNIKIVEQNKDGIFEPGELIEAKVSISNVGAMPTPSEQDITFFLKNNKWVYCPEEYYLSLPRSIQPGETVTLSTSLYFYLNDGMKASYEELNESVVLDYQGIVGRVNRPVPILNQQKNSKLINIEYPLVISGLKAPPAIGPGEEAPVVWKITNKSDKDLGEESAGKRLIKTYMGKLEGQEQNKLLIFRDEKGRYLESEKVLSMNIGRIKAHESVYIRGTIGFKNDAIKDHDQVALKGKLEMAHLNSEKKPHNVQKMIHSLQFEKGFDSSENSEVLLVTNHNIKPKHLQKWINFITEMGLKTQVWNLSYYDGLDFDWETSQKKTLQDTFQGKLILILDKPFSLKRNNRPIASHDHVKTQQLFELTKKNDVQMFIVGGSPLEPLGLWPTDLDQCNEPYKNSKSFLKAYKKNKANTAKEWGSCDQFYVHKKWRVNSTKIINHKLSDLQDELEKTYPNHNFLLIYTQQSMGKNIGTIKVVRLIDRNQETLYNLESRKSFIPDGHDEFMISFLKVLPFEYKLNLMNEGCSKDADSTSEMKKKFLTTLSKVMISDLLYEQTLFRKHKWIGHLTTYQVKQGLKLLRQFANFSWDKMEHDQDEYLCVQLFWNIIAQLDYYSRGVQSRGDRWFLKRRNKVVSKETRKYLVMAIVDFFQNVNPSSKKNQGELWLYFKENHRKSLKGKNYKNLRTELKGFQTLNGNIFNYRKEFLTIKNLEQQSFNRKYKKYLKQGHEVNDQQFDFSRHPKKRLEILDKWEKDLRKSEN